MKRRSRLIRVSSQNHLKGPRAADDHYVDKCVQTELTSEAMAIKYTSPRAKSTEKVSIVKIKKPDPPATTKIQVQERISILKGTRY